MIARSFRVARSSVMPTTDASEQNPSPAKSVDPGIIRVNTELEITISDLDTAESAQSGRAPYSAPSACRSAADALKHLQGIEY